MIGDAMAVRDKAATFRQLIEPLDMTAFVAGVWERRSMVFHGSPERFQGLDLDFAAFARAIHHLPPNSIRANSVESDGTGRYPYIDAADCRHRFEQGQTICVTELQTCAPRLLDLARDTHQALGLAGTVCVNAYLSPAGRGFGLHFDTQSVFILQLEGEKHWRYGDGPAVAFPPEGMDACPDAGRQRFRERYPAIALAEPGASAWHQCLLRPGDVLYLPPGTWHQGTAGDYSLALTLTCCTHDFSALLTPLLRETLLRSEPWRRNLPCRAAAQDGRTREAFIADRIVELRQWAEDLSPPDLARLWEELAPAEARARP
ncbi:cupin domain-containing protein [Sphingomonas sp. CBMAI 2297]|uniref:JmjC domain-containing protein n=1 Tax=Sphingomonas sp. CBMAI 2297 TaxID=2991720 RepID=UPI00245761C0|nr:cupin domain-containing protein [Sphingomonas sp. CBMAI 2297]MDH4744514.1 cupin domain-containing protein [Sphingomonas sp. CBMAI 2297]